MGNRLRYIGYLLLLLKWGGICAQSFPNLLFNHITTRDGLSSNTATCVTEDKQGFIWIGTDNGLNRYDGYRVKQYFHNDTDSNSLVFNDIQSLYCDRKGRLWIITGGGVSCFLPDKNIFVNYSAKGPPGRRLKNYTSVLLTEEKDGTIWLTHQRDVIFRVGADWRLQDVPVRVTPFAFEGIVKEGYDGIFPDSHGNKWAFCANRIYQLDPHTLQPRQTFSFARQLGHASIRNMMEDTEGNYWVTTWGEAVWLFQPRDHLLTLARKIPAIDILEWRYNDRPWMVAAGIYSGVYLFGRIGDPLRKLEANPTDPYSLQGTIFFSLFTDRQHTLWVCTNNGVNYMVTSGRLFDIYPVTDPGHPNYERETTQTVFSYFEDNDGAWLSKRYKATFRVDRDMRVRQFYTSLYPLSGTQMRWKQNAYYFFEKENELYISTDSGLVVYDLLRKMARLYLPSGRLKDGSFRTIVDWDSSNLLLRTVNDGLFVFNMHTRVFGRHFSSADTGSVLPGRLNYLLRTSKGQLFVSGEEGEGLVRYSMTEDRFTPVHPTNEPDYHLLSNRIFGMDEDRRGRIWLATSNGIFIYDGEKNRIEGHFAGNGKMGDLFRVCFDKYGNVWANGSSGIWCYITARDKWINFNGRDGLPGNDFEGILARKRNGDIVAGLEGAVAVFHPDRLYAANSEPPAIITEASIGDSEHLFPLERTSPRWLSLPAGQHSFSVDFSILHYDNAASMQYFYKLEPLMKDFRSNSDGHINFNGLMPGRYTLYVTGQGKTGSLYAKEDRMEIDIEPYWYQSWWFKPLVVLLLAGLGIFWGRWRITTIRKESALRQRIVETEMQALRAQMDPHFIFNSLSSIENFIMRNEKRLASDYLNKFACLIRMILDSSRNELVSLTRDMEALELYIDLEQISCNNRFIYTAIIDPLLLNDDYRVPPLLIQPYVENAIIHGLMPSRMDNLKLTVIARLESDRIRYIVEDNGVGRAQAATYQSRNKPFHESVGMKITEERVHLFNRQTKSNGSIIITDLYGPEDQPAGTRVEITIKAM